MNTTPANTTSVDTTIGDQTTPSRPADRTRPRKRAGNTAGNDTGPNNKSGRSTRSARATGQKWVRRLHSWLSLTSLLVVLFFAVTGITLNHPTWFGASTPQTQTSTGVLPAAAVGTGSADPLAISEYLRSNLGVTGQVTAHAETAAGGTIDYEGPGTTASVTYTTSTDTSTGTATGTFKLTTTSYGLVGVLNDLHKGRHTGTSFAWVIDVSGGLLILVAVTGLLLQLYIRRSRRTGLILVGIGTVAGIVLMLINR